MLTLSTLIVLFMITIIIFALVLVISVPIVDVLIAVAAIWFTVGVILICAGLREEIKEEIEIFKEFRKTKKQ